MHFHRCRKFLICCKYGIIHPLRNTSMGEEGYLDWLRYCLIHIESYAMKRYERGRDDLNSGTFDVTSRVDDHYPLQFAFNLEIPGV